MPVSPGSNPEKRRKHMKRALLTLAAALILLNTLVIPAIVHADGVPEGTNCNGNVLCKP
jgi:hypothetical protein